MIVCSEIEFMVITSRAHLNLDTTDFSSLCACVVSQSLVKVKAELSVDVAWLTSIAAANIRPGQRQEDLCMWLLGACD